MCVWQHRKIRSTENHLHFYQKISHFKRKIIYALILPSNNFRKPHLKREISSSLLTLSKTHIQAHLNQALASPDCVAPLSKTHLQAYLQTIFKKKKKKESNQEQEEKVEPTRSRTQPQIAPPHLTPDCTGLVAPQHRRDLTPALARLRHLKHQRDRTYDPTHARSLSFSIYLSLSFNC